MATSLLRERGSRLRALKLYTVDNEFVAPLLSYTPHLRSLHLVQIPRCIGLRVSKNVSRPIFPFLLRR